MCFCASNINYVMMHLKTSFLCKLFDLKINISKKVLNILRTRQLKVRLLRKAFQSFVEKQDLVVFSKNSFPFNPSNTINQPSEFNLLNSKSFSEWIAAEGVKADDLTSISNFCKIDFRVIFEKIMKLHFENGYEISIFDEWPANVTVGRVTKLKIWKLQMNPLPIEDKNHVEEIFFYLKFAFEISFLEQFSRLKRLEINGNFDSFSKDKPSLPYLEELSIQSIKTLTVETSNLRILSVSKIVWNEDFSDLVFQQTHLLYLKIFEIQNFQDILIPSSINSLILISPVVGADTDLFSNLVTHGKKLKLRNFETNFEVKVIDWLISSKLKSWKFNEIIGLTENCVSKVKVLKKFDSALPFLKTKVDECEVYSDKEKVLYLVASTTSKLTLNKELKQSFVKPNILENVKELVLNYKVSAKQARILKTIFPQFSEKELIHKGNR